MEMTGDNVLMTARICHEANRAYCLSIGDGSQLAWADAPAWQQTSAYDGVGARAENPDAPASASHENWLKHKEADGWVYGEVKDPEKKTHPCMVPFDQLPPDQQRKDVLFSAICRAVFEAIGALPGS